MELPYLVVAILAAAFTGRLSQTPFVDGDLYWQRFLGAYVIAHHALPTALGSETFTAAGAPWTPQEWLLGLAAFAAMSHGALWMLVVAAGGALAATLLAVARRGRIGSGSAMSVTLTTLLCAADLEGSFGIRAQVFAWPLFALLLLVLDLDGPAVFAVLAIVVVWANVHASVMLAVPIVWIDAAATLWQRGMRHVQTQRRLLLALLVPLATLATPLGIALPRYAWMLIGSPIRRSINEWQPISLHDDFFWVGAVPMLVLVALCVRTLARERPRDLVWIGMLTAMSVLAVRDAALLGIVVAPAAARAIDLLRTRLNWKPPDTPASSRTRRLAIAATVLAAALAFVVTLRLPAKNAWTGPAATFARLAASGTTRHVFCYDFSVCSMALQYGNLRVFMDGRADPYPLWVWSDFDRIRAVRPGWEQRLDADGVDTVVVKRGDALDAALAKKRRWKVGPSVDRCCRVYERARMVVQTWRRLGGRP